VDKGKPLFFTYLMTLLSDVLYLYAFAFELQVG